MPKQGLTEVICILDRSGSMHAIQNDAIGGFNSFLEDNKKNFPNTLFTVVMFNDTYKILHNGVKVSDVPKLDSISYYPSGQTAMLDAIGKTIDEVGRRLANTKEEDRPERIMVSILTDGQENASLEYTYERIREMIKHQTEKYSWLFTFLAANQDAVLAGSNIGISVGNSLNMHATGKGIRSAYHVHSLARTAYQSHDMGSAADSIMVDVNQGSNTVQDNA